MSKKITIIVISILMAILIFILGIFIWYNNSLNAVSVSASNENKIEITIDKGMSKESIISLLKENNLIKDELATKIYIKLNNISNLQAGKYELSQSMSVEEILSQISSGSVKDESVTITFLEGKNMRWIAKTISEETNNSEQDVFETLEDETYIKDLIEKYWFLSDTILNNNIYYPLEGYLYPETYTFKNENVTVEEIFDTMLKETDEILSKYKTQIEQTGYSVHQILTIASIVELEGNDEESREGIASVIYNRIKSGMSLGSDVTTYYAFKVDIGERDLSSSEINTYNPYNTRGPQMNGKLPVGPIASVSEESIKATLNPTKSNYLYFVADKNGKIYFTNTYTEHKNLVNQLESQGLWYEY